MNSQANNQSRNVSSKAPPTGENNPEENDDDDDDFGMTMNVNMALQKLQFEENKKVSFR